MTKIFGTPASFRLGLLVLFCRFATCKAEQEKISAFTFQVINASEESVTNIIEEILFLQNSLIVDNQATVELPHLFKENGFLTIRMKAESIMDLLLDGGYIITARTKSKLIGYALLAESTKDYFHWLKRADHVEMTSQLDIGDIEEYYSHHRIKVLEQIAVDHAYSKHGIGRELVNIAKNLAPNGLSTDILYKPFTNQPSLMFFSKQGFIHIAVVHITGKPPKHIPHEIYIELWQP